MVSGAAREAEVAVIDGGSSTGTGSQTQGAARELQKCDKPIATVALSEDESNKQVYAVQLVQLKLPQSPIPLLRLMFQQSNCFQIVDRGRGLTAITTEQKLAQQGLLKEGSNITGGQLVAADYTITPNIAFSEANAGGAALGVAAGTLVGSVFPAPVCSLQDSLFHRRKHRSCFSLPITGRACKSPRPKVAPSLLMLVSAVLRSAGSPPAEVPGRIQARVRSWLQRFSTPPTRSSIF